MTARDAFVSGVRDVSPMILGVVPFGLVAGVAAVDAGFAPVQAVGMSVLVFAGASQLAAIDLLSRDAPLAVVVLTVVVINLRLVMYSASIAPYVRRFAAPWKWLAAYVLVDQAYALSLSRWSGGGDSGSPGETGSRKAYYFGVATTLWVVWQLATAVGAVVGAGIPAGLSLEFAVPLTFIALLVPVLSDRPTILAAVVGGGVGVAAAVLPFNLGIVTGAVCGIAAGVLVEVRAGRFPNATRVDGENEPHGDGEDDRIEGDTREGAR